jgi:RNA polymerase sigma-70 factor (ECF subfamily)
MPRTEAGLDDLYRRYHRPILAYCLRRTSRDKAHEAMNETFTVAWRRAADLPPGDQALPWLYGVARNVLAHQHRSATRFTRLVAKTASIARPHPPQPDAIVVQRQEYDAVIQAVDRLSRDDREMLLLSAWEGLTHAEIAENTGYSLAAVDKRLARAKKRLKRQFEALASTTHRPPTSTARGGDAI